MTQYLSSILLLFLAIPSNSWPILRWRNIGHTDLFLNALSKRTAIQLSPGSHEVLDSHSTGPVPVVVNSLETDPLTTPGQLSLDQDDAPNFITLPIVRDESSPLARRGADVRLYKQSDVAYYIELSIGTPPQNVYVQLDTGSFELWVNPDCASFGGGLSQANCLATGSYLPSQSSTAVVADETNRLVYGIGAADVTYVEDTIAISNASEVRQVKFGVATSSQDQFSGVLGIGFGDGVTLSYPSFIDQLAAQGVTKTRAFSIALGSKESDEGVMVFGGVDTSKFYGILTQYAIIPASKSPDGVPRYWIRLNSISMTKGTASPQVYEGSNLPVFIDSGSTLTLLPTGLANRIAADFGSSPISTGEFYAVDCAFLNMTGTLNFNFNGTEIRVPYRELVRELVIDPPQCFLGIMPSDTFALLGDTFLRSAYVVIDIDGSTVSLAPYANCGTKLSTIKASSNLVGLIGDCQTPFLSIKNETRTAPIAAKSDAGGLSSAWMVAIVVAAVSVVILSCI